MKLEEAIEIQTIHNDHNPNYTDKDRREAHQLSIEALKHLQTQRQYGLAFTHDRLPGETED